MINLSPKHQIIFSDEVDTVLNIMFILKIVQCYGTILGVYVDLFCTKWFLMNVITRLIKNHTVEHFVCNITSYNFVSYNLFSILSFYFARNNKQVSPL